MLSDVVRGNELDAGAFWWRKDGLDMNETRTLMAHLPPGKNDISDTVLALTAAKKFHNGYDDVDYGISTLGGACGNGERYK